VKLYCLERRQLLDTDLAGAWGFFSDPRNLPLITPPGLGFRITCELPARIHPGLLVTYRLSPLPFLSVAWLTEITHMVEPTLFVDEQRAGPYRFWHHQHHFREVAGGVEMRDIVTYALPLGAPGRLAAPLVRRRLDGIFDFREETIAGRIRLRPPGDLSL
jgi:ligand-binding SRPBCC domain-containing protein